MLADEDRTDEERLVTELKTNLLKIADDDVTGEEFGTRTNENETVGHRRSTRNRISRQPDSKITPGPNRLLKEQRSLE